MIWVDAQLSPYLATWLEREFNTEVQALRDIGLRDAKDEEIFVLAKRPNAIIMTKDEDFIALLRNFGPPPSIIWIRCGNTSNSNLRRLFLATLPSALEFLAAGETLIEITEVSALR